MTPGLALLLVSIFLVFVLMVLFALYRHPGFRGRSIEEVAHYMHQVREYLPELEEYLDPERQAALKKNWGEAYPIEMARLVRCFREFLKRMRTNAGVLAEFAETERYDFNKACRAAFWSLAAAQAGHAHLSRLERMPEKQAGETWDDFDENDTWVTAEQLADSEATVATESEHLAGLRHRLQAAERFMLSANRCHAALALPLLRATLWNMVPFARLRFLPVPKLASFGNSGKVYVPAQYRELKAAALELLALLYPGGEEIRNEIEAQM
ncbi:MAG TPA: hypothetical protein VG759_03610 [Candidatus Angelobacter sp.]|jgi:hypothetical protein|nr:hypothetical protein [Candidatus Angelobacter sp.]